MAVPVSALLIAVYFSPETQGYYYTFASLVALQVFVELGLGLVIIHYASHEWASLKMGPGGEVVGSEEALSRLRSIAGIAARWFGMGSVLLVIGLATAGAVFFSHGTDYGIGWQGPWFALCVVTGLNIAMTPIWSLLEGCNQVVSLYSFRLVQGVVVAVTDWTSILAGAGLWTPLLSTIAGIVVAAVFLWRRYRPFLRTVMLRRATTSRVHWRADMLPMQWRIAVSWASGYFAFSLFTPVLFKYHGPVVAGQMGMTWSLVGLLSLSTSWLYPRVPMFGMLVAQRNYDELDRLFWRVLRAVFVISAVIAVAIMVGVYLLNEFDIPIRTRILPPAPIAIFVVAQMAFVASLPFSSYLRAHKKEPLMHVSILMAILVAVTTLVLGKLFSSLGVASGYLIANIIIIPLVLIEWHRRRHEWHRT
jgi:O-antigen/teichoic acid export membrane protein